MEDRMKTQIIARPDHLNLSVHSLDESIQFYRDVFGFELVERGVSAMGNPFAIVRSGDFTLCMGEYSDWLPDDGEKTTPARHRIFHLGLSINDVTDWGQRLKRHNLVLSYGGAVRYPHSTSWYISDPNGYEIEVVYWDNERPEFG